MFTAFTTQLVGDEIAFLLIAETELQATALARALNRQGVHVVVALYDDVKNNTPTWQATKSREYYKLIWLVSAAGTQPAFAETMRSFLGDRYEPAIVVTHVTHPLQSNQKNAEKLVAQGESQVALVEKLQETLPAVNIVLATDVIDSTLLPYSFFSFMQSDEQRQLWLDPALTLYPQREEDVVFYLATHLLRPHTTVPYLVRGKEVASAAFLKKVQHTYRLIHGQERPIKVQPIQIGGEWSFTVVSNPHTAPLETMVDHLVRSAQVPPLTQTVVTMTSTQSDLPEPQPLPKSLPKPVLVKPTTSKTTAARLITTEWSSLTMPAYQPPPPRFIPPQITPPPSAALNPRKVTIPRHVPPRIENRTFSHLASHYAQSPYQPVLPLPPQALSGTPSLLPTLQQTRSTQETQVITAMRARMRTVPPRATPTPVVHPIPVSDAELDKELSKLFSQRRVEQKVERVQNLTTDRKSFFQKVKRKKALFTSSVLGLGISLGLLAFYLTFITSYQFLKTRFVDQLSILNAAQVVAMVPEPALPKTLSFVKAQLDGYQSIFSNGLFVDESALVTAVTHFLKFQSEYEQARELGAQAIQAALGKSEGDSVKLLPQVAGATQRAYEALSQYQASLKDFDEATLSEPQRQTLTAFNTDTSEAKKVLLATQQLNPLWGTFLGVQQKRTYALLFQNNQELRPTGGYVQAVAIVTFDKGRLIDSQVFSANDIDSKQVGTVTPPPEIQRFLGEQRWYFRDVNWDPDFPTTAMNVNSFLEKTVGRPVDGVIGMNLFAVETILKATGPLELPEYNEIITDRNLQERVEFHSEIQLVPSDTKTDYSTTLLTRLLAKMTSISEEKSLPLATSWYEALESKQLQIAMINASENLSLASLGWTGGILTPQCPAQLSGAPCLVDTVAQFEANVGINKANYHVTRDISQTVTIEPGTIRHQRNIIFTNNSRSNAWPQGSYKAYTRLYLPGAALLDGITINGSPLPASAITTQRLNDKLVVGFASETPIQTKTTIQLKYHQAHSQTLPFSYVFFNQQQAGVVDGLSKLVVQYDPRFKASKIAPQGEIVGPQITFKPDQTDHAFIGIEFK